MRVELSRGLILKMNPQYDRHGHVQAAWVRALIDGMRAASLPWQIQIGTTKEFGNGFEPMPVIV